MLRADDTTAAVNSTSVHAGKDNDSTMWVCMWVPVCRVARPQFATLGRNWGVGPGIQALSQCADITFSKYL